MSNYVKVKTSPEVWAVIRARHGSELVPFSSYSDPDGTESGGGEIARMETGYGFKGHDFPILYAVSTWRVGEVGDYKRHDEKHEYWLCVGKDES